MTDHFAPRDRPADAPLYKQVCWDLERLVLHTPLADESPLPPEHELMARFGVSRGTLRHAVDELDAQGLLRREPGRGTFVNPAARLRRIVWGRLAEVARPDSRYHLDFANFVPDFVGSDRCNERIRALPEYQGARTIFITPDNNLEALRAQALDDAKELIVCTPEIRRGFLLLQPGRVPREQRELAATLDAQERFGAPLTLQELRAHRPIDLVLTGAAAVTAEGVHFGKGHGYLDLEWGLLRELRLVGDATPVVVSVHDCQVINERVPYASFDCTVDVIVTPQGVLRCAPRLPKPIGIQWTRVTRQRVESVTYLRELAQAAGLAREGVILAHGQEGASTWHANG